MKFTILGARGFIGSHLVRHLQQDGHECLAPDRNDPTIFGGNLGHLIYCAGLTADFLVRPFDTARAHVCHLADVLEKVRFESLLYLSSTRLYDALSGLCSEEADLLLNPHNPRHLYDLSKAMGESLCLGQPNPAIRVARLACVYDRELESELFVSGLIRRAIAQPSLSVESSLDSQRDYVLVDDVVALLARIAAGGRHRMYNVASGVNVSNGELFEVVGRETGCDIRATGKGGAAAAPVVDISRIRDEFGFAPCLLLADIPRIVSENGASSVCGK